MGIIGNALSVLALKAKILVTTMPGSTVTFTKDEISGTVTADESGNCEYEVLIPNFGTWTVTATNGNASGTAAVDVTDIIAYSVTVTMRLYFIQNGDFAEWVTRKVVGETRSVFADKGSYVWLTTDSVENPSNIVASGYFTNEIDMGFWKTLYVDSQEKGQSTHAGLVTGTTLKEASFTNSVRLAGQRESYDSRSTKTLDVTSVTGTRYVALRARGWILIDSGGATGAPGIIRVWNMYLEG